MTLDDLPEHVKNSLAPDKRPIINFKITPVSSLMKTGSALTFLSGPAAIGLVLRHTDIPPHSMACWEFLETYAHTIFPPDTCSILFGERGEFGCAPIIKRNNGCNRVCYSKERPDNVDLPEMTEAWIYRFLKRIRSVILITDSKEEEENTLPRSGSIQASLTPPNYVKASALSRWAGNDTNVLVENLQITDHMRSYFRPSTNSDVEICTMSVAYNLAKDLFQVAPLARNSQEIMSLIEEYWKEFIVLNNEHLQHTTLQHREMSREDFDQFESFWKSSLTLVKSCHTISTKLSDIYNEISKDRERQFWNNKPIENYLLLLIHFYQLFAQQSAMWWLGISHGHLHPLNVVSQISLGSLCNKSPLKTNIIDFDKAAVSTSKLSNNDELYNSVLAVKVMKNIMNPQLNSNVRCHFIFYLPLEYWDESVADVLKICSPKMKSSIASLVSSRAIRCCSDEGRYSWFADIVYNTEKQRDNATGNCNFYWTISMVKARPNLFMDKSLSICAQYFMNNSNFPYPNSQEGILLLLRSIDLSHTIFSDTKGSDLTDAELTFLNNVIQSSSPHARYAKEFCDYYSIFLESENL